MTRSEFQTRVAGIPCICSVEYYTPVEPATFHDPAEGGDFDFSILDRRGKPAPWLEAKLTPDDSERLFREYEAFLRDLAQADAEPALD